MKNITLAGLTPYDMTTVPANAGFFNISNRLVVSGMRLSRVKATKPLFLHQMPLVACCSYPCVATSNPALPCPAPCQMSEALTPCILPQGYPMSARTGHRGWEHLTGAGQST
jgi:hypothetical protein